MRKEKDECNLFLFHEERKGISSSLYYVISPLLPLRGVTKIISGHILILIISHFIKEYHTIISLQTQFIKRQTC